MCPPGPSGPVLPPTAGTTLTQLEMFQKPLKVLGRTLGHTPLGVFCWLEVIDFDPFLGFLLLAPHVCYFSFAGSFYCFSRPILAWIAFFFKDCAEPLLVEAEL